jgi:arginine-tRNA-protein transferase
MKIFYSEHNKDYTSYTFDYAVYAMMEKRSEVPEIYDKGFLPYSNDPKDPREIFYMARSLRVNLKQFKDSSENRRVDRKLASLGLIPEIQPVSSFNLKDSHFQELCIKYAVRRFSGKSMTKERFDYITSRGTLSHIISFSAKNEKPAAYVFCNIEDKILHYWYAFFNADLLASVPIGKWLMWKTIDLAKSMDLNHVYIGTCYGEKSLYKVRDFKALSFFDGEKWNSDMQLLKSWCKSDDQPLATDRFKL